MSAQPNNIQPMPGKRFMEVTIKGKIEAARRHETKHYTRPQVVEVRSNQRLGQQGDEVTVDCKLGGYTRKPFRSTDKDTGEISMVTPVDMTLDAND